MTFNSKFFKFLLCSLFFFLQNTWVYSQSDEHSNAPIDEVQQRNNDIANNNVINENELLFTDTNAQSNIELQRVGILDVIRIIFVLVLLLALGIGIIVFLKKLQNKHNNSGKDVIDLLSTKTISQNTNLHLIKIGNSYLLIANSNQNARLIKEFQNKEEIDELTLALSVAESHDKEEQAPTRFLQRLGKVLQQLNLNSSNKTIQSQDKKKNKILNSTNYLSSILGGNNLFGGGNKN